MDINKVDIKLMASQRLDDTDQGGGQMTATEIISGSINNLFADISRLDRVYGRVSLRKVFAAVQTMNRPTYYGSHAVLTRDAADPNVSVCFFSSKDWFDVREDARQRIESYLVKGPMYPAALWGPHFMGTRQLSMFTEVSWNAPDIGDVLVFVKNEGLASEKSQYLRVTKVSEEIREFTSYYNGSLSTFKKKVLTLEVGNELLFDFAGTEVLAGISYSGQPTKTYSTVAADASRYYGVAQLKEDAMVNSFQLRVDSINVPLVPSAYSPTAITDAGVGQSISPMLQSSTATNTVPYTRSVSFILASNSILDIGKSITPGSFSMSGGYTLTDNGGGSVLSGATIVGALDYNLGTITFNVNVIGTSDIEAVVSFIPTTLVKVVRSIAYTIGTNSKLYIGEGILPGSFVWSGGLSLLDDGSGNILNNDTIVGSITYATGIIIFAQLASTLNGTGTASYIPACQPTMVASTGGIQIEINNRGFAYVFSCDPLPKKGTLRIEYLSGGKWYTMQDRGDGAIRGYDPSIGSGVVNSMTGSVAFTTGAMPDVGSIILLFWSKDAPFYDLSGDIIPLEYQFTTKDEGITRNSFICSWKNDTVAVKDNGNGALVVGTWNAGGWTSSGTVVGTIEYATGKVYFKVHSSQASPTSNESFFIRYSFGDKHSEEFNPIRNPNGTVTFHLAETPIVPGTFRIEWHTDQEEYDGTSNVRRHIDPTHIFNDDTFGHFKYEVNDGTTNFTPGSVDYTNGQVSFMPDRRGVFPVPLYIWQNTGLFDEDHKALREYVFVNLAYRPAASIWPTDGIIQCSYQSTDGSNSNSYYEPLPKTFYIKQNSNLEIVPGSLTLSTNTYHIVDIGSGVLFHSVVGTTGVGTECGRIDYVNRKITITDNNVVAKSINVISCSGTSAIDPVQMMVFRAPGAPLVPGSFGVRATLGTGTIVTGNSDFSGKIVGNGVSGLVDFETGIARVSFGKWVTDTWSELSPDEQPEWYYGAPVDGTLVWKPYSVRASTVMINCVVSSYLPLDADLLGLDPVRLPIDGRVPIFRDGNIILIHHTQKENLPNPAIKGTTYPLNRGDCDLIELYDSTGLYYPEIDNEINYTVDLATGSVTISPTASFVGYTQPFYAINRIEDMCLASDVQITGHISLTNKLTHNYPKDETMVSSVLPSGDLQSRAFNEFVQSTWTGVWSDDLIGVGPLANYDFVNYPITVYNKGATKERWLLKFKTATVFDFIGEKLGTLASDLSITGWPGGLIEIRNRLTGELYLTMNQNGFGAGWSSGNCIRYNTDAANFPYWFIRTTLQAPPTEPTDSYEFQIRGDSA